METGFTVEELKKGVKNPFFNKLCKKTEVVVTHEDYEIFSEVAKMNGEKVKPEDIMNRCLADYAKLLKEAE